jgi:hypothetical protein
MRLVKNYTAIPNRIRNKMAALILGAENGVGFVFVSEVGCVSVLAADMSCPFCG